MRKYKYTRGFSTSKLPQWAGGGSETLSSMHGDFLPFCPSARGQKADVKRTGVRPGQRFGGDSDADGQGFLSPHHLALHVPYGGRRATTVVKPGIRGTVASLRLDPSDKYQGRTRCALRARHPETPLSMSETKLGLLRVEGRRKRARAARGRTIRSPGLPLPPSMIPHLQPPGVTSEGEVAVAVAVM